MRLRLHFLLSIVLAVSVEAAEPAASVVALNNLAFFYGREYYVLRSGRAEMIVQADRADLGPAFTYLVFDSQNAAQSTRKENAFNYSKEEGFSGSALHVVLGGCDFTALGHRTETHWTQADGVPAIEAVWWAGGVRVTEQISALAEGVFRRAIRLRGAHLAGAEEIKVRLSIPIEPKGDGKGGVWPSRDWSRVRELKRTLAMPARDAGLALIVLGEAPVKIEEEKGVMEIGPLRVRPDDEARAEVLLVAEIPVGDPQKFAHRAAVLEQSAAAQETSAARDRWAIVSSIGTADKTIKELFDKARFGLPGMVADDGMINAGIFEYGAQWVRDSANTALGLIHAGHFELARGVLDRIVTKMITQEGVTMIGGGFDSPDREQFDQMGELMHVLKAYRDWTGDDSLVRQNR